MAPRKKGDRSSGPDPNLPVAVAADDEQIHSQQTHAVDVEQDLIDEDAIFANFEGTDGDSVSQTRGDEEIKDDESAVVRRSVQLAQAIMHVGPMDPHWKASHSFPLLISRSTRLTVTARI
jgi:hypothetical protein